MFGRAGRGDFGRSFLWCWTKGSGRVRFANPVGPLHIGSRSGPKVTLLRILAFAGYEVEREYYVNDHGSQMDVFGHSISKRYLQLIDIMQKGIDADAAARGTAEDRNACVRDSINASPEEHPSLAR